LPTNHIKPVKRGHNNRRGFALVLALALMSLVFLLVVTLITQVGAELRLTELRKQKVLAAGNARMGLMVAIGELQKHAGLDTRSTGTASLLDDDPSTPELEKVANPYWTGIWKRQSAPPLSPKNLESSSMAPKVDKDGNLLGDPPDVMYDSEFDDHPANEVAWLVSGNEGKKFQGKRRHQWLHDDDETDDQYRSRIREDKDSDGKPDYFHPVFDDVPDPDSSGSESVWIVNNSVLDPENIDPVLYGKVKVMKTEMTLDHSQIVPPSNSSPTGSPGSPPISSPNNQRSAGAYAYWVGDEGVKTKANVVNPHKDADISSNYGAAESNLIVSPEPNLKDGHDLVVDPAYDENRRKVINLTDIDNLSPTYAGQGQLTGSDDEQLKYRFHTLTTHSAGILSDVSHGGLKRDLTGYFGKPDDDWTLIRNPDGTNIKGDGEMNELPLFHEQVHYLKEFAAGTDKANFWRYGNDAPIDSKNGFMFGPMWNVLRDYYKLYEHFSGNDPYGMSVPPEAPDRFPQRVGDHFVTFDSRPGNKGGSSGNTMQPYLRHHPKFSQYGPNSYNMAHRREEPSNHPIGPVLVELQHRQIIYTAQAGTDSTLRLAIMPTFALWNPYNVKLSAARYQMEYKMRDCTIAAYNTKEREIFYKWSIHSQRNAALHPNPRYTIHRERARDIDKNGNYYGFWGLDRYNWGDPHAGGEPYMDINLNSRFDPGEPFEDKNGNGSHDGGGGANDEWRTVEHRLWHEDMSRRYGNKDDLNGSDWITNVVRNELMPGPLNKAISDNFLDFRTRNEPGTFPTFMPYVDNQNRVQHFQPYRSDPTEGGGGNPNLPLKLLTELISFEPGQKLLFCVEPGPNRYQPGTTINMVNHHGSSPLHHVYFEGDASRFSIPGNDPITIRHVAHGAEGFNRGDSEQSHNAIISQPQLLAKGIVLYLMDGSVRRPLQKVNKEFGGDIQLWRDDYRQANDLAQSKLPQRIASGEGLGYRIRRKISTTSQRIVFHEFNPRALVDSYQDGSGDLWQVDSFHRRGNRQPLLNRQHVEFYTRYQFDGNSTQEWLLSESGQFRNVSNWDIAATGNKFAIPDVPTPDAGRYYGHLGHSHSMSSPANLPTTPRLALFDVPRQPMLSIAQFQHANLSWYSHSPAYIVGNSYATGQVARYKKWGRVSRIIWQPEAPESPRNYMDRSKPPIGSEFNHVYGIISDWWWDSRNYDHGMGVLRDAHSEVEHQNVTIDQSVYANETLFDGYYFSSVPTEEVDSSFSQREIDDNTPLRNGRLLYYRDKGQSPEISELRAPETANANLLVNGMFNINSTSVAAWMAQLASLSGKTAKMLDVQDQHMLSGSAGSSQTINFSAGKFPFLRHTAPFGEEIPPASQGADPNDDYWTGYVVLNKDQLRLLAEKMVTEVKIRGPFLSLADFINRRITKSPEVPGKPGHHYDLRSLKANIWPAETPETEAGFRGTIQAAIANAGFNNAPVSETITRAINHDNMGGTTDFSFRRSIFGEQVSNRNELIGNPYWGRGIWMYENDKKYYDGRSFDGLGATRDRKKLRTVYKDAYDFGEAPDNLQAIESSTTAAMMPGWLTQGDVLTPLAPVISPRSDTFIIRTYGEPDEETGIKRYCEAVVQRIPDYVINGQDASFEQRSSTPTPGDPAHHRPREPFDDWNGDGIWTDGEPWLDLNQNSPNTSKLLRAQGNEEEEPDLPDTGWNSDREILNLTNRKFGRKFRIVKFRWLTEEEV
jgi:hypothetical protein